MRETSSLLIQIEPGQFPTCTGLQDGDDSDLIVAAPEQVFRKVEPRTGKPADFEEPVILQNIVCKLRRVNLADIPDQLPELCPMIDRPSVQRLVIR